MKRLRAADTADWIANVIDAEDRVIRKRDPRMHQDTTGYSYRCIEQDTSTGCAPESDFARGKRIALMLMVARRLGEPVTGPGVAMELHVSGSRPEGPLERGDALF